MNKWNDDDDDITMRDFIVLFQREVVNQGCRNKFQIPTFLQKNPKTSKVPILGF